MAAVLENKCLRFEERLRAAMAAATPETLAGLPYHLVLKFGPSMPQQLSGIAGGQTYGSGFVQLIK